MTFTTLADRFKQVQEPNGLERRWESPYRLLGGAFYSLGCGLRLAGSPSTKFEVSLPQDWRETLEKMAGDQSTEVLAEWWDVWSASYMLTNAIFRIAAATEKATGLIGDSPDDGRNVFSQLQTLGLTNSYAILKNWPTGKGSRPKKKAILKSARDSFAPGTSILDPLLCAIIQTDNDKHSPYPPVKDLNFDSTLASSAFVQACDVWDEIVVAAKAKPVGGSK